MAIERRTIRSDPRATSPRPWVEASLDPVALTATITRVTGPAAAKLCTSAKERAIEGAYVLTIDPTKPTEMHYLAITSAGAVIFEPASKLPAVLYAHLGWVDPVTRNAVLLEFADDTK